MFLMGLFGIGGITILALTWLQPMPVVERIMASFVGSLGLLGVLGRGLWLKFIMARTDGADVKAEAGLKSERH